MNQRQIEIFLELSKTPDEFRAASYFVKEYDVSLRTIQGDMKIIKNELEKETCVEMISKSSKGNCLHVNDYDEFSGLMNTILQNYSASSLNYPTSRASKILLLLLEKHRPVSMQAIEDEIYVSRSTLLNDFKKVEELLARFDLSLIKTGNRVMIEGSEMNKRRCFAEKNTYLVHIPDSKGTTFVDERQIRNIRNVLMDTLIEYDYKMSDADFDNAILRLNIMIRRMQNQFYINPDELELPKEDLGQEQIISEKVMERLSNRFFLEARPEEVTYFALYLKGQGNCQDTDIIPDEINEFVAEAFRQIKNIFDIDFTDNVNLRISLALHCVPLSYRIRYDMQVQNSMLEYIKKSFPLGYDIGTYFGFLLQQRYEKRVSEDEIALLAIHFYSTLMELNLRKNAKRILIISSMKKSMEAVLHQTFMKWFSGNIACLEFTSPSEVTEDVLDQFDIFLTTEKGEFYDRGLAMYINPFPTSHDYFNIKLNMDGFKDIDHMLHIFSGDRFFVIEKGTKEEILDHLCANAEELFELDHLREQVQAREEIGSTFFGNHIAVAHPVQTFASDTFMSVCISKEPVVWDEEGNKVNLILLNHIGKNNPQAFQLWDYISKMFIEEDFAERIAADPTYDKFIARIQKTMTSHP